MTERTLDQQEMLHLGGQVELRMGSHNMVANIRGGTATVTVIEEDDDDIHVFGAAEPIRSSPRLRLRIEIEGPMEDMTLSSVPPK